MSSQAVAPPSKRAFWEVRSHRGGCVSGTVCSSFLLVRHGAGKGAASMKHPLMRTRELLGFKSLFKSPLSTRFILLLLSCETPGW